MTVANKVTASAPIRQPGSYGYLLWVRRDLPPVYSQLVKTYPQVANFESALQRQASGLGQDLLDTDDIDESGIFDSSIISPIDEPVTIIPPAELTTITVPAPDVTPVPVPVDTSGAAGEAASNISGSTLSSIANTVATLLPAALKTATAVVNSQTASKTLATAQLQAAAALAGKSPLQTGIVTTANGTQYLSALNSAGGLSDLSDTLSFSLGGLPLWAWGLIGLGALAYAVRQAED